MEFCMKANCNQHYKHGDSGELRIYLANLTYKESVVS
jgi:hypothetical protein